MTSVYNSFQSLPPAALQLLKETQKRDYFQGYDWLRNLCANGLEPGTEPRLVVAGAAGKDSDNTALLSLRHPPGQPGSIIQGWRAAGRGVASLTSYQSVRFGLLLPANPANHPVLARQLAANLASAVQPALLDLSHLEPACPGVHEFSRALEEHGYAIEAYQHSQNIFERVAGLRFSDYLQRRPSQVRLTAARKARQLERHYDCRFRVVSDSSGLEPALADYEAVLEGSWKDPEPFPKFTRSFIKDAAKAGVLRLGRLHVDGVPVAAQIWIISNGRATIYKLHYLSSMSRQAVGAVLSLKMFQYMLEVEQVTEIDFGVGGEPHKRDWLAKTRPLSGLLAFEKNSRVGRSLQLKYLSRLKLRRLRSGLRARHLPER